jgi:hypothetical protein
MADPRPAAPHTVNGLRIAQAFRQHRALAAIKVVHTMIWAFIAACLLVYRFT